MNKYDTYKDSGIQWLGEVPVHWIIGNLTYFITCSSGDALPSFLIHKNESSDYSIPVIGGNGLFGYTDNSNFTENCLAIGRVGALCGNVHYINYPSWINDNALIVKLHSNKIHLDFLDYFFKSRNLNELASKTAQPLLTGTQVKKEKIAIPPLAEQTAIASYLDNKLCEIDTLIHKQETLLEKLAEQRTAIITQAVTKGLNANAKMKNSCVAWLGEVPAHWEIKQSNQIFKIHNGATPKTSEPTYWGDEIAWFTPKDLGDNQGKEISGSLKMITQEGYANCGVSLAPEQSIALSKRAPIGHLAITTLPAVVNQGCFLLEVLKPNNVNYLYYWLYANKMVLNAFGQGSTFMELPREKFAMLKISVPPLSEQTAIAQYLDEQTAQIDRLSQTVHQAISKLKEYRSTLITQAVTGKIKLI